MRGIILAATPMPTPTPTVDPELVNPGPVGLLVTAFLAIAVIVLIWDMLRRVRRVRYRDEVRAELDAEQAAEAERADQGAGRDAAPDASPQPGAPEDPDAGTDPVDPAAGR